MKFIVEIDTEKDSPCVVGETLRRMFWDEAKGFGCYSNFDWARGVTPLADVFIPYSDPEWEGGEIWHCAEWSGIVCRYYWDGDGTLEFVMPDGEVLHNGDCKYDHEWEWLKK